jgi:hypothetical protein
MCEPTKCVTLAQPRSLVRAVVASLHRLKSLSSSDSRFVQLGCAEMHVGVQERPRRLRVWVPRAGSRAPAFEPVSRGALLPRTPRAPVGIVTHLFIAQAQSPCLLRPAQSSTGVASLDVELPRKLNRCAPAHSLRAVLQRRQLRRGIADHPRSGPRSPPWRCGCACARPTRSHPAVTSCCPPTRTSRRWASCSRHWRRTTLHGRRRRGSSAAAAN